MHKLYQFIRVEFIVTHCTCKPTGIRVGLNGNQCAFSGNSLILSILDLMKGDWQILMIRENQKFFPVRKFFI